MYESFNGVFQFTVLRVSCGKVELTLFPFAVTCFPGLADLLLAEAHEAGFHRAYLAGTNLVVLGDDPLGDASQLTIARRVLRLFAVGSCLGLTDIVQAAEGICYGQALDPELSFGVTCQRLGNHDFTSEDVGRALGSCVRRYFRRSGGVVPPVDLRCPQQLLVAEVHENTFFFGFDTVGSLDKRWPQHGASHAPLNPTIAAAMLRLSSFKRVQSLLDPMAGSGTIVLEAATLAGDAQDFRIIAGEQFGRPFTRMQERLASAGVAHRVEANLGDATNLSYVDKGMCPLVVVNPPYGIRIGTGIDIEALYNDFCKAARAKNVQEVVAITTRKRAWLAAMASVQYEEIEIRAVIYGRLAAWIMMHRRLI